MNPRRRRATDSPMRLGFRATPASCPHPDIRSSGTPAQNGSEAFPHRAHRGQICVRSVLISHPCSVPWICSLELAVRHKDLGTLGSRLCAPSMTMRQLFSATA